MHCLAGHVCVLSLGFTLAYAMPSYAAIAAKSYALHYNSGSHAWGVVEAINNSMI